MMNKYRLIHNLKAKKNIFWFFLTGAVLFDLSVFFLFADMAYINHQKHFTFSRISLIYIFLLTCIPLIPLPWIWGLLFFLPYKFNKRLGWFLLLLFSIVLCQITIFLNSVSYFKKIYFDFYDNATIINLTQKYDFHLNKRYGMLKTEKDFLNMLLNRGWKKIPSKELPSLVKKEWSSFILEDSQILILKEEHQENFILTNDKKIYYFYFIER